MTEDRKPAKINPRVRVIPTLSNYTKRNEGEEEPKIRIAAYARVSTMEEEQQSSYQLQVSYFEEYIEKNPAWVLYKVYSDEGVTGTNTKYRTGFNQMIKDAKEGKFDYIITKSISRFARNTLDCLTYVRMLKSLDKPVGILFDREKLDSLDSKSEVLLTIISSIAEEESKTISANVSWGVQKRFSQGKAHIPTTYFLGYDEDDEKNLIINDNEAKIVKRIFKEYLGGKGTVTIAKDLTKDKLKTARGNTKWTSDAVIKIIKNEKYCGHALCQKSVTLDPLTHKRVRNKNHKPQYFIRNNHPAIIAENDWNMAQKEVERRRIMFHDPEGKYRRTYSNRAPLSNMLYCGECGMSVTRRRLTSQINSSVYKFSVWQCSLSALRMKADFECNGKYIWEAVIEQAYNEMLLKMTYEIDQIRKDGEEAIKNAGLTTEESIRLEELGEIIERINNQISEMAMRENVKNDPIYDATLRNLIYESQIYQQEHEALVKSQDKSNYFLKNLDILIKKLEEMKDFTIFDDQIFKELVEQGSVHNDYRIEFVFKCGVVRTAYGWKRGRNPVKPLFFGTDE